MELLGAPHLGVFYPTEAEVIRARIYPTRGAKFERPFTIRLRFDKTSHHLVAAMGIVPLGQDKGKKRCCEYRDCKPVRLGRHTLHLPSTIEDQRGNTTRFLVIGRETPAPSGQDLTSAVFTVRRDQSGALHNLLGPFASHGVNLTAVQSRPMKGKPWEYIFIVDMEGHQDDAAVAAALAEAGSVAASHKVLGSFPRALEVSSGITHAVGSPQESDS